jgi:hypothetical protein
MKTKALLQANLKLKALQVFIVMAVVLLTIMLFR